MTTILSVHNNYGEVGRCDAKCHNATKPECKCICGGKNHGVGLSHAIENTKNMTESFIKKHTYTKNKKKLIIKKHTEKTAYLFDMTELM